MADGYDNLFNDAGAGGPDAEEDHLGMEPEPAAPANQQSQEGVLAGERAAAQPRGAARAPAVLPAAGPLADSLRFVPSCCQASCPGSTRSCSWTRMSTWRPC